MNRFISGFASFILLVMLTSSADAQFLKVLKRQVENQVKNRASQRVGQAVDKGLDKVEGAATGKEENKASTDDNADDSDKEDNGTEGKSEPVFSIESKFDFVPGEKITAYEDFSKTELGDFPENWNTDGKGEVVKIKGWSEKWLYVNTNGTYTPDFSNNLPDNFTFELDLASSADVTRTDGFSVSFYNQSSRVEIRFKPGVSFYFGTNVSNHIETNEFHPRNNLNFVHISFKIQNERLRVYMNQKKVWDLPKAFAETGKPNGIKFQTHYPQSAKDGFFFTNLKLATGDPDTRNKLLTAGKFVTNGILFNVNSDEIKPESAGILKQIANVLKEDESLKMKIIGYTDGDGDAESNLDLSKRRAAAVKDLLLKSYEIKASRMEADGMGSSKPVADNKTPEGKAQNRRVEFIKL